MGDDKCFAKKAPENGPPLFQHGDLVFQGKIWLFHSDVPTATYIPHTF